MRDGVPTSGHGQGAEARKRSSGKGLQEKEVRKSWKCCVVC